MRKTVLITGVNGFLGNALWRCVNKYSKQFRVFGVDVAVRRPRNKNIFCCDLLDEKKVTRLLAKIKPDIVFHLAGGRMNGKKELLKGNFATTELLLNAVASVRSLKPRIVIPVSAAEYGRPLRRGQRMTEGTRPRPVNWYGFVKHLQTSLGLRSAGEGLDVVIARIFNITGTGTPSTLAAGSFARTIALIEQGKSSPVIETSGLSSKRDFLDVDDVASALLALALKGKRGEIYNVCSGRSYAVRDILKKLLSFSKRKDIRVNEKKERSSSGFDSLGSNAKIRKTTHWRPRVSILKSLKNTLQYYRKTT